MAIIEEPRNCPCYEKLLTPECRRFLDTAPCSLLPRTYLDLLPLLLQTCIASFSLHHTFLNTDLSPGSLSHWPTATACHLCSSPNLTIQRVHSPHHMIEHCILLLLLNLDKAHPCFQAAASLDASASSHHHYSLHCSL